MSRTKFYLEYLVAEYNPKPYRYTDMLGRPITNINNTVALITLSSRL
jgi:hypothetical protein